MGRERKTMTRAQEQRIHELESLLRKAQRYLTIMVMESFVYGEEYYECHYCSSDEPDQHTPTCHALGAAVVAESINVFLKDNVE